MPENLPAADSVDDIGVRLLANNWHPQNQSGELSALQLIAGSLFRRHMEMRSRRNHGHPSDLDEQGDVRPERISNASMRAPGDQLESTRLPALVLWMPAEAVRLCVEMPQRASQFTIRAPSTAC